MNGAFDVYQFVPILRVTSMSLMTAVPCYSVMQTLPSTASDWFNACITRLDVTCMSIHKNHQSTSIVYYLSCHHNNLIFLSPVIQSFTPQDGSPISLLSLRLTSILWRERGFKITDTGSVAKLHPRVPAWQQLHIQVRYIMLNHYIPHAYNRHRDQLRENVLLKQYYCDVDIAHLISFNEELAHKLVTEPSEIIPLVRQHPVSTITISRC